MDGRWHPGRPDMPRRLRAALGRVGARTRTPAAVLTTIGVVAAVLVVAIVLALTQSAPKPPDGTAAVAAAGTPTTAPPTVSTSDVPASPTAEPTTTSPSPTENGSGGESTTQPGDNPVGGDNHTSNPDPAPAPTTKKPVATYAPSQPTLFGAWWADTGKYGAKWDVPEDDGTLTITGYVVKKCDGTVLARVGASTFRVTISHPKLECMTVQAVNAKGEGDAAWFKDIRQGP